MDFYPRSPCGERRLGRHQKRVITIFLSTLSLRRATRKSFRGRRYPANFYPRSPCGERLVQDYNACVGAISIHALLAESDPHIRNTSHGRPCISIHALLAESDRWSVDVPGWILGISIHALLAESDNVRITHNPGPCYFYPRSPCGERPPRLARVVPTPIFLSTLSLRRAT